VRWGRQVSVDEWCDETLEPGAHRTPIEANRLGIVGLCWARISAGGLSRTTRFVLFWAVGLEKPTPPGEPLSG
jgi:hypothetical protein